MDFVNDVLLKAYNYIANIIPKNYRPYFTLGLFIILITLYAIFVWKFYRFLAKRDLLELNLKQYNKVAHSSLNKLIAFALFTLEYIIILPVVVFFWFFVMAIILILLAKELPVATVFLISACIIGAIRVTAYYNEELSREVAKMFPFTILVIALISGAEFFDIKSTLSQLTELGGLSINIFIYLLVIMAVEFVLRMLSLISSGGNTKEDTKGGGSTKEDGK